MGGSGSMLYAIKALKQNRALLKKHRNRNATAVSYPKTKTKIKFKKASPKVMEQLQKQLKKDKRQELKMTIISMLTAACFIGILYWLFTANTLL